MKKVRLFFLKMKCYFSRHDYRITGRCGGDTWGWNKLTCARCGKESDTMVD